MCRVAHPGKVCKAITVIEKLLPGPKWDPDTDTGESKRSPPGPRDRKAAGKPARQTQPFNWREAWEVLRPVLAKAAALVLVRALVGMHRGVKIGRVLDNMSKIKRTTVPLSPGRAHGRKGGAFQTADLWDPYGSRIDRSVSSTGGWSAGSMIGF